MERIYSKILQIAAFSASSFAGIWLILETLTFFGIETFEKTGLLGYSSLTLASLFSGLFIVFLKSLKEDTQIDSLKNIILNEFSGVYTNKREAEIHIKKAVSNSSIVKILAGRGNELQRETYSKLFETPQRFSSIQILLANPFNQREKTDWLNQREQEVISFDKSFVTNTLRGQIKTNIDFVKNTANSNSNFHFRLYNIPHLGLITITDSATFFYFLKPNAHGRDCMMFKCDAGSEFYKSLTRYFDEVWKKSIDAK